MASQIRKILAETLRGTLVLLCLLSLATPPARAAAPGAAVATAAVGLRSST